MADQTVRLPDPELRAALEAAADVEGRIPRTIAELGPVDGRDVLLLDPGDGLRARQLAEAGGRVTSVALDALAAVPDGSADVVVACWNAIAPGEAAAADEVAHAMRALRPGGRLIVVHDYGRDDVTLLVDPARRPRLLAWSKRDGPFLGNGFKVKVLHCRWTWDHLDGAAAFLSAAFGEPGAEMAAGLRRPFIEHKVAVYHRDRTVVPRATGKAA